MAKAAARKTLSTVGAYDPPANDRLYQRIARQLVEQLTIGTYAIGDRLPAERELAIDYGASRPAVREALIALEVQGLIEVRVGSGAYVCRLPGQGEEPGFAITAFELTEARIMFEGEAAALAAVQISDGEVRVLDGLVDAMTTENLLAEVTEIADRDFHMAIAKATRNAGVVRTIEDLWHLRSTSPECALLHAKARNAKVRPVVAEHAAIVDALRARDAVGARAAMRAHLTSVMDHLLFQTEEMAMEQARLALAETRQRYGGIAPS
ncbi:MULTISPECIES: FadR/GntR family transcriptional regulator [Sphingomonas]|jgi:DNA-binding FadR family transcriptional regulator|uniref:FadR/GntR family transcriptional regulator n=1 Tax=Sphingomonas TaxID=13687 RepID=UPI001051C74B|nr:MULTISPECIES: FadR/GntR family transcriptional regulator [Sphingomonas]TCQ02575.1 GntR family transcriptional regulator [Sphingomonas sp. PP-CC-3A-396]